MSSGTDRVRFGGLLLSGMPQRLAGAAEPLRAGPDVSWLSRCRVGDDQGSDGACAVFAFASWAEIVHGREIPDAECLDVYRQALARAGRTDGGLTFPEAFGAAALAGWLPGGPGLAPAGDLSELIHQPLVAGYVVTQAWDYVSPQGCLDHAAEGPDRGYHAVVIAAHGVLAGNEGLPLVYVENSWSLRWGWNGIGVMTEALHRTLVRELWKIE